MSDSQKVFVKLLAYCICMLVISAQAKAQYEPDEPKIVPGARPIETWSMKSEDGEDYQCVQKCYPLIKPTQPPPPPPPPALPQIVTPPLPPPPPSPPINLNRTSVAFVEKQTHVIDFIPEILTIGYFSKQCCYLTECIVVGINEECPSVCYEPCDEVCTGNCLVNPICPNKCEEICQLREQYMQEYKMWLAMKLNEIKLKYRQLYEECVLRTSSAFSVEMSQLKASAKAQIRLMSHAAVKSVQGNDAVYDQALNGSTGLSEDYYLDEEYEENELDEEGSGSVLDFARRSGRNYGIEINIEGQKNFGSGGMDNPSAGGKPMYQVNQNIGINNRPKETENEAEMDIETDTPASVIF